ncbi:hypothetical protein SLS58_004432 [Diplodia intermedia]|uniref:2-nitropropane dioxygenase n=1 Tax=Diplodia intermedia TaxID=856260 RepID=A0ABR3TTW8_9PEZI
MASSSSSSTLYKNYPWTQTPLIINGPMAGSAGPELAAAVTNAGGIGFIGGGVDMAQLDADMDKARSLLAPHVFAAASPSPSSADDDNNDGPILPIGIGILCFGAPLAAAAAAIRRHRPAAVWLFAARDDDGNDGNGGDEGDGDGDGTGDGNGNRYGNYAPWTAAIRAASPRTAVWIQIGSVGAALAAAATSASPPPDVLVAQGADAGGHGFERGAGVVALVPEVADALAESGLDGKVAVVAAGGIVEARGAAAALALGAGGVVMGTRFLASEEVGGPAYYGRRVLEARDGGVRTVRSKAFDEARAGGNVWPALGLVNRTYADFVAGGEVAEIRRLHGEEQKGGRAGDGEVEDMRVTVWAGTGVGLVKEVLPAGRIVEEVREGARKVLKSLSAQV